MFRIILCFSCVVGILTPVSIADIFRWTDGSLIAGTQGITPGPGVQLDRRQLDYAALWGYDLTGANFEESNLPYAYFSANLNESILANASFTSANLTNAILATNLTNATFTSADLTGAHLQGDLTGAVLTNAILTDAEIGGAVLNNAVAHGFVKEQLYATASYKGRRLGGTQLSDNDLSGWDFGGQDLSESFFEHSALANANFRDAQLTKAALANANLVGAVVTGAKLGNTTARGFVKEQFYVTRSYEEKDLQGIGLSDNDVTDWDFRGHDLANASFARSILTDTDLRGSKVAGASFSDTTSRGFTKEQLYGTASYIERNLARIDLSRNNLAGWDFRAQNLSAANFRFSTLTTADFSNANVAAANFDRVSLAKANFAEANLEGTALTGAVLADTNFTDASIEGAVFVDATANGFVKEQLYGTATYKQNHLRGVRLYRNDLTAWTFSGLDLANAGFDDSRLAEANFTDALVAYAGFGNTTSFGFTKEQLYSTASYEQQDLRGIGLSSNDLTGWDFSGQDLRDAGFGTLSLPNTILTGADLRATSIYTNEENPFSRNAIFSLGIMWSGLSLNAEERLLIRDDDVVEFGPYSSRLPIPIQVQLQMSVEQGGTLELRLETDPWDSLISFQPGIPVQLGGTLELNFVSDVDITSQIGRTFHIFDWTGVAPNGAFTVSSAYPWDVSNLYTTGEVTLLLPGDTNGDQIVSIEDLNNVRNNFGLAGTGMAGDTNADGFVDLVDLSNVRNFFGVSTAQAVPEPSALVLAIAVCGAIGLYTSRRQRGWGGRASLVQERP